MHATIYRMALAPELRCDSKSSPPRCISNKMNFDQKWNIMRTNLAIGVVGFLCLLKAMQLDSATPPSPMPISAAAKPEMELNPEQQQRAGRLYRRFIAPCCWRQSVAEHRSPEATLVRSEIDRGVREGQSDSEIKNRLIHEYGNGILLGS